VPRITLTLLGGFGIFLLVALVYSAPVLVEPLPSGAVPGYRTERVKARLEGKVPWLLGGAMLVACGYTLRKGLGSQP